MKLVLRALAFVKSVLHLCISDEVFTVARRKPRESTLEDRLSLDPPILIEFPVHFQINPQRRFLNSSLYPKRKFMKAISTFVSLFLIISTCATSAVLYLNENYNISAALTIVWIVALTLWIGKAIGLTDLLLNNTKTFAKS
jgi:hypothetical protein